MIFMEKNAKIYVAGHTGLVGSAVVRMLQNEGYKNLILYSRAQLDLLNQQAVINFFQEEKPEFVIDCAAKVGGIKANMTYPADFLYDNLQIQNNLIWASKAHGVKKFLFLGSSCIYPRDCPQPMKEMYFMTGPPEPTNEGYAYAKIAGIKMCEYIYDQYGLEFISCMPTNIYGPGDNFDPESSHVIPSLIRRMHKAKIRKDLSVEIWGSGLSRREFLYVDDLASGIIWMMQHHNSKNFLNIGTGEDISIKELAYHVKDLVGYQGELTFNTTKPDGMPKKLLDISSLHSTGWQYSTTLEAGLKRTYNWYLENKESLDAL